MVLLLRAARDQGRSVGGAAHRKRRAQGRAEEDCDDHGGQAQENRSNPGDLEKVFGRNGEKKQQR